eukprot:1188588-Prorocentrum_minimum.AAC.3
MWTCRADINRTGLEVDRLYHPHRALDRQHRPLYRPHRALYRPHRPLYRPPYRVGQLEQELGVHLRGPHDVEGPEQLLSLEEVCRGYVALAGHRPHPDPHKRVQDPLDGVAGLPHQGGAFGAQQLPHLQTRGSIYRGHRGSRGEPRRSPRGSQGGR